jgi:rod shape-determining protein MreC
MQENHNSKYSNIVLIILLLVGFLFIAVNMTPPIKLIKNFVYYAAYHNVNAANQIFQSAGNFAGNIKSIVYVSQENNFYKQKNQELIDKLRNYEAMCAQYNELIHLLDIAKMKKTKSVFARVSVREPGEWYQWLIIDKGLNHNLYNELPVVVPGPDGTLMALGRIVETYKNSAKVALITSALSAVPAKIKNKKIDCLAEGSNSGLIKITYLPLQADIEVGDVIVTSPLSSVFSEGIYIGVVTSVATQPALDFQTATAEVMFDSDSLYEVIVLVPEEEETE